MKKQSQKKSGPIAMPRVKCMFNLHPDVAAKIREGARENGLSMSAYVASLVK